MTLNSHLSARERSLPAFIYRYSCEFNELIMSNGAILSWEEKQKEILDDKKRKLNVESHGNWLESSK